MSVIAVGMDIQEIDRIRSLFKLDDEKGLLRVFTSLELEYCLRKSDPYPSLAGRFSAKESVIKILGVKKEHGMVMDQIEIINDEDGSPYCELHGSMKDLMIERGGNEIMISISHTGSTSAAVAILVKR